MAIQSLRSGRRQWKLVVPALTAVVAMLLAACSSSGRAPSEKSGASGAAGPKTVVRVAFNPGTCLNLYAALAHGLFAKHNLDVKLVQFQSGAAANAAYASGSVDIGYSGIPGILGARLATDMKVFMVDNEGYNAEGLVAGKNSGINSIKDLAGKTIGTAVGTTAWMALVSALAKEGVPQDAVKIENVGPTAWIPALSKGDVDGIWGWAPLMFQMEQAGGHIVATDSKYDRNPLLWQVRAGFLKDHPKAVTQFVAAYDEAASYVSKRDPAFIKKMVDMTGSSEQMVIQTIDAVKPVSVAETATADSPYSLTSPDGLAKIIKVWANTLLENKILKQLPSLDGLIDPTPVKDYLAGK